MLEFLVIKNSVVFNKVIADSKEIAENLTGDTCVLGQAELGWFFNEETGAFSAPPAGNNEPLPEPEILTAPTEG